MNSTKNASRYISPAAPPVDAVSIVTASDNNFVPHLAALIESIKDSLSPARPLDLVVLDGGISDINILLLQKQFHSLPAHDGKLSFIDCTHMYVDVDTHMHFATPTFYRLNLGELLRNHKRVVYLDTDTIVLHDISKLFDMDLGDNVIAAAPDVIVKSYVSRGITAIKEVGGMPTRVYLEEYLGLKNVDDYFQGGVIVFNLDLYRALNLSENILSDLSSKRFWFVDQDILNKYLCGKVKFLDTSWNCVNMATRVVSGLNTFWADKVVEDLKSPKIVHFAGHHAKPWNNLDAPLNQVYWHYLRKTFWYEAVARTLPPSVPLGAPTHRSFGAKLRRSISKRIPSKLKSVFPGLFRNTV